MELLTRVIINRIIHTRFTTPKNTTFHHKSTISQKF